VLPRRLSLLCAHQPFPKSSQQVSGAESHARTRRNSKEHNYLRSHDIIFILWGTAHQRISQSCSKTDELTV